MSLFMTDIIQAAIEGAGPDELNALAMPDSYRASFVRREDVGMFDGLE